MNSKLSTGLKLTCEINKNKIIHIIGIGGIGMSGIAEILHNLGYTVKGSDIKENSNTLRLKKLQIKIYLQHNCQNIENADIVVISSAISKKNCEVKRANKLKIPVIHRADMLAEIIKLTPAIVIAGSHGKTTTTSIGASVLDMAGINPTVISGGIINTYGTNAKLGKGEWTLVEADESDGTFANLPAAIAIVTNIDREHLDYYGSYELLQEAFYNYLKNIPFYGLAILCADNQETYILSKKIIERRVITYGIKKQADVCAYDLYNDTKGSYFKLKLNDHAKHTLRQTQYNDHLKIFVPTYGTHNIVNSLAIITCALELNIDFSTIQLGLKNFNGVKRRMSIIGEVRNYTFIDDYAHHPTEIKATLEATRQINAKANIVAIFQPHRYSRLNYLFNDFTNCFSMANKIIVLPVYEAGEKNNYPLNHEHFFNIMRNKSNKEVLYADNLAELTKLCDNYVHSNYGNKDKKSILLFMGAGDITNWCHIIFTHLEQKCATKIILQN